MLLKTKINGLFSLLLSPEGRRAALGGQDIAFVTTSGILWRAAFIRALNMQAIIERGDVSWYGRQTPLINSPRLQTKLLS